MIVFSSGSNKSIAYDNESYGFAREPSGFSMSSALGSINKHVYSSSQLGANVPEHLSLFQSHPSIYLHCSFESTLEQSNDTAIETKRQKIKNCLEIIFSPVEKKILVLLSVYEYIYYFRFYFNSIFSSSPNSPLSFTDSKSKKNI